MEPQEHILFGNLIKLPFIHLSPTARPYGGELMQRLHINRAKLVIGSFLIFSTAAVIGFIPRRALATNCPANQCTAYVCSGEYYCVGPGTAWSPCMQNVTYHCYCDGFTCYFR
jgi:hypothetical protein